MVRESNFKRLLAVTRQDKQGLSSIVGVDLRNNTIHYLISLVCSWIKANRWVYTDMECLQYLRWWSERHKEQTFPMKKTTDKVHLRIIIIHQSILIHTNQYKFFNQISYQLIIYFFILEKMRQRKKSVWDFVVCKQIVL